ncbi:MAG: Flp pilus assembly complex ATPase component TadA [Acidobacteria bacterium]|nr:Flp pilus assembly complex ATPase component TadA [Acidobacteriota bacterium]
MTDPELDDRLAELLIAYQLVSPAVLERARAFQTAKGSTLAGALAELHLVAEDTQAHLLEELTGVRAVDPSLMTVYPDFVERMNVLIPPEVIGRLLVFPAQAEINAIHVCMLNPTDGWTGRALESLSGCRIVPFVSHESALLTALEKHYGSFVKEPLRYARDGGRELAEAAYRRLVAEPFDSYLRPAIALINRNRDAIGRDRKALESVIRDPILIRLVQQILSRAVEAGASDLHIEPIGDSLRIRVRIDGALRAQHSLSATATAPIVARLKAMADLPIEPATTPLDARIGYEIVWGRGIDLRFSLVPAVTGEKIVLRVLDRTRERRQLLDLGMDETSHASITVASDLPNGLILVTGPTGSGKSSTLYALLDRLNEEDVCILTAEDPVESRVAGVTQVQCDESSGVSFASALRSFLRQDPDVIMVGEIRDAETADTALKSALTGHLVLSTLHTNDATGAVLRLINMNLEPFMIASALRLVVAQRLIRKLCKECKRPLSPSSDTYRHLMATVAPESAGILRSGTVFEPVGCPACGTTGYRGRTGIYEVLRITEGIEELILSRAAATAIRAVARSEGMRTLRDAGWLKVAKGETSIAEVFEHTIGDDQPLEAAVGTAAHA